MKWIVLYKERGNEPSFCSHQGDNLTTEEQIIDFFGLNGADVESYQIERVE